MTTDITVFALQKCTQEVDEQQISVSHERFKRIYEMVESKLNETTLRLEPLLTEERTARLKAEEIAKTAQKKLDKKRQNKGTKELDKKEILVYCDEQYKRLSEMASFVINGEVELKMNEKSKNLERILAQERSARLNSEEFAKFAPMVSEDNIQRVELNLKETTLKVEQLLVEEKGARLMTQMRLLNFKETTFKG